MKTTIRKDLLRILTRDNIFLLNIFPTCWKDL